MPHIAVYGTTKLKRGFCPKCKGWAFIIRGLYQCCNARTDQITFKKYKIMAGGPRKRKRPLKKNQKIILNNQQHVCLYCNQEFERFVWSRSKHQYIKTKLCWDHFVPYSYNNFCKDDNFVAACSLCNLIKSDRVFDTVAEAQEFIKRRYAENYANKDPDTD